MFTEYLDLAQVALYAFWIFFFALVYYLRREDKREGYPLRSDRGEPLLGFPVSPGPKQWVHAHHPEGHDA
ncbi:MAG: hypothetical protein ACXW61_08540 [Gemmatirosa sp.]